MLVRKGAVDFIESTLIQLKSKRILSAAMALAMLGTGIGAPSVDFSGGSTAISASAETYGDLTYTIRDDGTVEITGCDKLYPGTKAKWNAINVSYDYNNEALLKATIHCSDGDIVPGDSSSVGICTKDLSHRKDKILRCIQRCQERQVQIKII